MINAEYNTPPTVKLDFRFFILEPCSYQDVEFTFTMIEKMFGKGIFDSATLVLKDCNYES